MLLPLCPDCRLPFKTPAHQPYPFSFLSFPQYYPQTAFFLNPKHSRPSKSYTRCSASRTNNLPESAIKRISDKLRSLGYADHDPKEIVEPESEPISQGSAGQIFVPLPRYLPKYRVGHTIDTSWSLPDNPVPSPGSGSLFERHIELRSELRRQTAMKGAEEKRPTLAQLTFSKGELRRLQRNGIGIKKKLKVGKAGITEGIINGIHERWKRTDLVKIECEDLCKINMKRTHDLLEKKTGGFVIWRSGSKIVLYRGPNYKYPYFIHNGGSINGDSSNRAHPPCVEDGERNTIESKLSIPTVQRNPSFMRGVGLRNRVRLQLPAEKQLVEEAECILDGLGPRFTDWWGRNPQPVDADLLPGVVFGYRKPFRLLPYGVKPKLTNDEMTILKRLGRPLPCHFALGRNRAHQGLAVSIIKLWEKCEVAKIAVKRGVQNTNSLLMAEELKKLTGGTLLSRDKYFFVLYRGKDFLPMAVSSAIEERRKSAIGSENQKKNPVSFLFSNLGIVEHASKDESDEINDQSGVQISAKMIAQSTWAATNRKGIMLSRALEKRAKAEKLLSELEERESHKHPDKDNEGITQEERYMLRRVGLRMKPFLILGKRGVFDGTVENMHLHWKYRELVKILCNPRENDAHLIARTLEAESGGILVAIERVSKGYAIIVYRGKNYRRPASLRPQTLLSKRQAMKRFKEAQRSQSLKHHILKLNRCIDDLRDQLDQHEELARIPPTKESKIQSVAEDSTNNLQSSENESLDFGAKYGSSTSSLLESCREEMIEASDKCDSLEKANGICSTNITEQHQEMIQNGDNIEELDECEPQKPPISAFLGNPSNVDINSVNHSRPEIPESGSKDVGHHLCENEKNEVSVGSDNENPSSPDFDCRPKQNSISLSNRDRLLLRKQALGMKKRPVLSVGMKGNVNGVAKTINTHFKKHPLAIINVKARPKGTRIDELIFKLEQATGGILVSQEVNKVILYRGWGAKEEPPRPQKAAAPHFSVSPQLIAAVRSECGFQR